MNPRPYRSYPRRWLVLAVTMLVNATIQALWISYAPVAAQAAQWFGVSEFAVGFFAMSFMIAFIPFSLPASWLIDRFGFATMVGWGALLVGILGLVRGLVGPDFLLAMTATVGLAILQPLFLNAWTKMPAEWFPSGQRATVVGLTTLANIVGTALGLVLTPLLLSEGDLGRVQLVWGGAAMVAGLLFAACARNRPPSPPDAEAGRERALVLEGIRHALGLPSFRRILAVAFIGMGVFNGLTTWIEALARPRGVAEADSGLLGAILLLGGLMGAILLPLLSDRLGRRRPFIIGGLAASSPLLILLALGRGLPLLSAEAFLLGFFLVAVSPIAMQYAAETARPSPEGATNGLFTLAGQASVVLVMGMEALDGPAGNFTLPLLASALLVLVGAWLSRGLAESATVKSR